MNPEIVNDRLHSKSSLIRCKTCGGSISKNAMMCPHCGEKDVGKPSAFAIEHLVKLNLDFDLALALGDHILSHQCTNPAIVALGHQLQNLEPFTNEKGQD